MLERWTTWRARGILTGDRVRLRLDWQVQSCLCWGIREGLAEDDMGNIQAAAEIEFWE